MNYTPYQMLLIAILVAAHFLLLIILVVTIVTGNVRKAVEYATKYSKGVFWVSMLGWLVYTIIYYSQNPIL